MRLKVRIGRKITFYDPNFDRRDNDAWITSDIVMNLEDVR